METTIQDICREEKERQHKTLKDISDNSDISLNTVTNFFSSSSKQPSFYTVGPICKALGVSMDQYFGLTDPQQDAKEQVHALELENTRLSERNSIMSRELNSNRRSSLVLLAFNTVLTIALLGYLIIDANIRTAGLIQFGEPSTGAVALMALSAFSVLVIIAGVVNMFRKRHK